MRLDEHIETLPADVAKGTTGAQRQAPVIIAPARIGGRPILESRSVTSELDGTAPAEAGGRVGFPSLAGSSGTRTVHGSRRTVCERAVHCNSTNVYPNKGAHT